MKNHRKRSRGIIAAAVLATLAAGCASDPLSDSIGRSMEDGARNASKADSLMRVAASTARAGDVATAAALYRRAHSMDENNAKALIGLGNALSGLGSYEGAREAYRKALDIKPDNPDALHGLGNSLIALDQPAAAIDHFEAVLKKRQDARSYNGIGVAHDMMGDHAGAQAYYKTGLKTTPGNLSLRNNLGLSLALAGDFEAAIKLLRRVASDPRAGSRQRLNLALVYGLSGDSIAAAEVARIDLDEPAVRRNLAYYRTLRALKDPRATLDAVGRGGIAPEGFNSVR